MVHILPSLPCQFLSLNDYQPDPLLEGANCHNHEVVGSIHILLLSKVGCCNYDLWKFELIHVGFWFLFLNLRETNSLSNTSFLLNLTHYVYMRKFHLIFSSVLCKLYKKITSYTFSLHSTMCFAISKFDVMFVSLLCGI